MSSKITKEQIVASLGKKFIKSESFGETFWVGLETSKNIIFWGPGGHAKSEMAKHIFDSFNLPVFIQALGDGTSEDNLLGGLDMKKFKEEGKIEYLVENSFMAHEYVIFEELLDCPSAVLLRLKDILTSGYFRNGTQQYKIKTKFIVCLTNRSREDVADDLSIKALMERFPLELHVIWDSYESKDYSLMYKKVLGKDFPVLAEAIAESNKTGFVSPRTAIHAAHVFMAGGFKALNTVVGINPAIVNKLMQNEKSILEQMKVKEMLEYILSYTNTIIERAKQSKDVLTLMETCRTLDYINSILDTLSVTDKNIAILKSLKDLVVSTSESLGMSTLASITVPAKEQENINKLFERNYESINIPNESSS